MAKALKIVVGKGMYKQAFIDQGTGVEIEYEYRLPVNKERIRFQNEAMGTKGKKVVIKSQAACRKLVLPLIKAFSFPNEDIDTWIKVEKDGTLHPLSCDPRDPGFEQEWAQVLTQTVPGTLEMLGSYIFAGAQSAESSIEFDYGGEDEGDEGLELDLGQDQDQTDQTEPDSGAAPQEQMEVRPQ